MPSTQPEPWLRGPVPGVLPLLQPAAHAFIMSIEDCEAAASDLTGDQLWASPGGAASVGFHLLHLARSTDRLMTYARGERLRGSESGASCREQFDPYPRCGRSARAMASRRRRRDRPVGSCSERIAHRRPRGRPRAAAVDCSGPPVSRRGACVAAHRSGRDDGEDREGAVMAWRAGT